MRNRNIAEYQKAWEMVRSQENKESGNALLGMMVHEQALLYCFCAQ